jgi:hypothetical protein
MFTTILPETYKLEAVFDAWDAAAHDAKFAWCAWLASTTRDRGDAYVSYRASLDREEHAAKVLATAVRSSRRRLDSQGSPVVA